ncbi:MAG TPA: methionine adenosyltransferase [Methylomirabilota bacterium]|nr:methionine adenosyltransferase [Methylomirabilota bacterium]
MKVVIEALAQAPVARRRIELVERKGLGHPDTICDSLAEAVAVGLNRMYLAEAGTIPHYNVDKALLVAGQCAKTFGRGEITRAMELILGDRATSEVGGRRLPVEETVHAAVAAWLAAHLPEVRPGRDLLTRVALCPGSAELRNILAAASGSIVSNDTSGAAGWAPLSPTEVTVLAVERFLNGEEFKRRFPDTGQDVKVFGLREDDRLDVTVAMPLRCRDVASERAYFRRKEEILAALAERFRDAPVSLEFRLNNLDSPGAGADGVYLTLTGTSAEDADSGEVGRGNGVNGLIAFSRPAGGEAAAGKNPVAHAGKIYSVLSHRLASLIHARHPELPEVYVHLAARIGEPVDRPWTGVQIVLAEGMRQEDVDKTVRNVVEAELARLPEFRGELIRGKHPVC